MFIFTTGSFSNIAEMTPILQASISQYLFQHTYMYISAGIFTRCSVVCCSNFQSEVSSILPLLIYSILIDSYIDWYTIPIVMWTFAIVMWIFCHCDPTWSSHVTMANSWQLYNMNRISLQRDTQFLHLSDQSLHYTLPFLTGLILRLEDR